MDPSPNPLWRVQFLGYDLSRRRFAIADGRRQGSTTLRTASSGSYCRDAGVLDVLQHKPTRILVGGGRRRPQGREAGRPGSEQCSYSEVAVQTLLMSSEDPLLFGFLGGEGGGERRVGEEGWGTK